MYAQLRVICRKRRRGKKILRKERFDRKERKRFRDGRETATFRKNYGNSKDCIESATTPRKVSKVETWRKRGRVELGIGVRGHSYCYAYGGSNNKTE